MGVHAQPSSPVLPADLEFQSDRNPSSCFFTGPRFLITRRLSRPSVYLYGNTS